MLVIHMTEGVINRVTSSTPGDAESAIVVNNGTPERMMGVECEPVPDSTTTEAARRTQAHQMGIACEIIADRFREISRDASGNPDSMWDQMRSAMAELVDLTGRLSRVSREGGASW